jgi:tetratricopeptide (TPR) repeat protein
MSSASPHVFPVSVRVAEILALSVSHDREAALSVVQKTIAALVASLQDQSILSESVTGFGLDVLQESAFDAIVSLELVEAKLLFDSSKFTDCLAKLQLVLSQIKDPSSIRMLTQSIAQRERKSAAWYLLSSSGGFSVGLSTLASRRRGAWFSHRIPRLTFWEPFVLHNMGLVEQALDHSHLSQMLFFRSFQSALELRKSLKSEMLLDVSAPISYHFGLSLLHQAASASLMDQTPVSAPEEAFRSLQAAAVSLNHSPFVFLRMAEACLLRYHLRGSSLNSRAADRLRVVTIGQRVFLQFRSLHTVGAVSVDDGSDDRMSLLDARSYLQTAMSLDPKSPALKFFIVLNLAYCSLLLSDYYAALRYASLCLDMKDGNVEARVAVSLWAAECLCRLDRPKEALRFLSPKVLESFYSQCFASSGGSTPGGTNSQSGSQSVMRQRFMRMRAALYVNLSSCLLLQGSFDKAKEANSKALEWDAAYPPARLNEAYMCLATGDTQAALQHMCAVHV